MDFNETKPEGVFLLGIVAYYFWATSCGEGAPYILLI